MKNLRYKKLNCSGIAHFMLPLGVILVVAAIGTYLLVASNANSLTGGATPPKAKAKKKAVTLNVNSIDAYANSFKLRGNIQMRQNGTITQELCKGSISYDILYRGKILYGLNPGAYAYWENDSCNYVIEHDQAYKAGRYTVKIKYYGNSKLNKASKTVRYSVKNAGIPRR